MKHAIGNLAFVAFLAATSGLALAQDNGRSASARPGTREWAWEGSTLSVGGSMIVHVRKDGPARVVMTGPQDQLDRAYLRQGHIGLEDNSWNWPNWGNRRPLEVTITGAALGDVTVSGSSQVTLDTIRRQDLAVRVSGSGSIRADGQVEHLDVRVSGSGNVRLDGMKARQGRVSVSGSGHVDVDAVEDADVSISGSGQVRIDARPRTLSNSISGSGRLVAGGESYTRRNRR